MRVSNCLAVAAALAALPLAACGALAQITGPSDEELRESLAREHPSHLVLDAGVSGCEAGTMDGYPVQVCGICVGSLSVRFGGDAFENGAGLQVWRGEGRVAFVRGLSADHPYVAPAPGERGAWLTVNRTEQLEVVEGYPLSSSEARRLGYQRRTGLGAWNEFWMGGASSSRAWGGRVPDQVKASVERDPTLAARLRHTVGACGG